MTESDQLAEAFDHGRRYQAEGCAGDGCIACAAWVRSFKAGGFAPTGGWQETERLRRTLREIGASINFVYDAIEGGGDSKVERMLVRIGRMTEDALAPAQLAQLEALVGKEVQKWT